MGLANLGDLVNLRARDESGIALIDLSSGRPRQWTFAELAQLSGGVATGLLDRGHQRGQRIGLLAHNSTDYLAGYFGAMLAGLSPVPMNNRFPREILHYIAKDSALAGLLADSDGVKLWGNASLPIYHLGHGFWEDFHPQIRLGVSVPPDAEAEVLYTSGSTGRPKGVSLSHAGQLWGVAAFSNASDPTSYRQIVAQPLFHMNGLVTTCVGLQLGMATVLDSRFSAERYARAIEEHEVDHVGAVPTMWARTLAVAEQGQVSLASVRSISLGSAPTTSELLERTRALLSDVTISLGYGTTEGGPAVFGAHPAGVATPLGSLGYPRPDVEIRLEAESDGQGILEIRTPAMMLAYLNQPELYASKVTDGWYHTGDVVRKDEQNFFYFVGRSDDMFICGGENIYPLEVERALERCSQVESAAVVALPDHDRGEIPVAFLVPASGDSPSVPSVLESFRRYAPPYMQPRRVAFVDELPLSGTNKPDVTALRERAHRLEVERGWAE